MTEKVSQGFTLIELIITIAILTILSAIAAPSFHEFIERTQTNIIKNKLIRYLNYARIHAIKSNASVIICASYNAKSCHRSTTWSDKRLLIFKDVNDDNIYKAEEDELLQVSDTLPKNSFLKLRAFQNKPYIKWLPQGTTNYQNGNFTYCPPSLDPKGGKHLIWNYTGRVYEGKDSDNNGIVENTQKNDISCL